MTEFFTVRPTCNDLGWHPIGFRYRFCARSAEADSAELMTPVEHKFERQYSRTLRVQISIFPFPRVSERLRYTTTVGTRIPFLSFAV